MQYSRSIFAVLTFPAVRRQIENERLSMTASDDQELAVNQPENAPAANAETMGRIAEAVFNKGDLSVLSPADRVFYVKSVCERLGLDPMTKPFDYIKTENGLQLYPNKECAAQLRSKYSINVKITDRQINSQLCIVTAQASMPNGRADESIGAVALEKEDGEWKTSHEGKRYFLANGKFRPLSPELRASALMKAETKAKRRATLSLCGLGMMDPPDEDAPRWDYEVPPGTPGVTGLINAATDKQAQPPEPTPPPAPPPMDPDLEKQLAVFSRATREQRLAMLAQLKHDLAEMSGDEGIAFYYDVLKAVGVREAEQLSTLSQAKQAYANMWLQLREGVSVEEPAP